MLKSHMQASLAWAYLTNPKNLLQTVVTIPEGKRASQVIAIVAQETKIPLKDFQPVLDHPAQLGLPSYANGKVEGYLFPATYAILPHETALQILQAMVTRFKQEAQSRPAGRGQAVGLTATEVIIEASHGPGRGRLGLRLPEDRRGHQQPAQDPHGPAIRQRAALRAQPYAINVTDKQIATPGPYNDFEHTGLPAGPDLQPGRRGDPGRPAPGHGQLAVLPDRDRRQVRVLHTPLAGQ